MAWYHYISGFWAGMFLANFVPHFVNGISGNPFPTPFAKPHGKGLSSPLLNVVWAWVNVGIGWVFFQEGKVSMADSISLIIFFAGFLSLSVMLSIRFARRDRV